MSRRVVAFRVGDVEAAVAASDVERILSAVSLLPAPNAPPWLVGLVATGDELVAAIDLARRLFPDAAAPGPGFWLLGRFEGVPAALGVSDVDGVLPVDGESAAWPQGLPPSVTPFVAGAVLVGSRRRLELDVPRLLDLDREAISKASGSLRQA